MIGIATALLIYFLVSKLWTILDPDSARYTLQPFRGLVTAACQVAIVVLCGIVVHLTGALLIWYIVAYLVLDLLAGIASER